MAIGRFPVQESGDYTCVPPGSGRGIGVLRPTYLSLEEPTVVVQV